jgi:serine/threonine protein kinase
VWAAGVILFILLSGSPPFYGRTHPEIFQRIKAGRWGFHGRNWESVSEGAKDLVRRMLVQDPAQRITAEGVLQHPWIK